MPFRQFNPQRLRSYLLRLPLCTRLLLFVILGFWIASLGVPWVQERAALVPEKINLSTMYRLNTFPLVHMNFFHFLFNILAVTPLLERFEAEFGTLVTLLLFTGPFGTIPGGIYVIIERFALRQNTTVLGASIWVFLLLSAEAIKTYKSNPPIAVGPYKVPIWTAPLVVLAVTSLLVPYTSFLGHLCGAAVGYLWGLGYIRFLAPPEKVLRWIEGKLNLLGRLPHYVSVDQKTYGRYGLLPLSATSARADGQRLGP